MHALRDLLKPERMTSVVDVGAAHMGVNPPYHRMLEEGLCKVLGVDPNGDAIAILDKAKGPNQSYMVGVVGDGSAHSLYLTGHPALVSCLEPDPKRMALFDSFAAWGELRQIVSVLTTRLDDLPGAPDFDFIKTDCQGYELEVVCSGPATTSNAVAVMVELSLFPLYKEQPTFGQVDTALRKRGFIPHCFAEGNVHAIDPGTTAKIPRDPHQIVDVDLFYVRDWSLPMHPERWKHLALIAHHVCGSFDLAMRCVAHLAKHGIIAKDAPETYSKIIEAL